jgi:hypothetical protein
VNGRESKIGYQKEKQGYNSKGKRIDNSKQLLEGLMALTAQSKAITSSMIVNTRIIIILRGLIL